ncbi:hypothetical protein BT96DRAFT_942113 [Gymnopus androsaceus JB14]|uniref:Uncharacterized protein n=1 Tax=Gymnopus androsaceus JB14 TaxID=1447944 RepID=A0A6A4HDL5_9AGAR|nr:hypothetical protein BT96DRAFT_942113 [Gymnopus androsaceus JB14]
MTINTMEIAPPTNIPPPQYTPSAPAPAAPKKRGEAMDIRSWNTTFQEYHAVSGDEEGESGFRATRSGAAEVSDGNSPERVRAGPREIWDSVKLLATPLTRRKVSREENNRVRPKLSQGSGTEGGAEVLPRSRGCVGLVTGNVGKTKARLGK